MKTPNLIGLAVPLIAGALLAVSACSIGMESKSRNAIAQLLAAFRGAEVRVQQARSGAQDVLPAASGREIFEEFKPSPSARAFLGSDGSLVIADVDAKVSVLFFQSKGQASHEWKCMVLSPGVESSTCVDRLP